MAKAKSFRLETLLSIRKNVLNEKQGELAKAYEAERILNDQRADTEREIAGALDTARRMMRSGGIDINFLLGMRRHEAYLLAIVKDIDEKLVVVRKEIDVRRQAVIEANKEFKILEKLKEKQHRRRMRDLNVLDVKQMDEIAEIRAVRLRHRD